MAKTRVMELVTLGEIERKQCTQRRLVVTSIQDPKMGPKTRVDAITVTQAIPRDGEEGQSSIDRRHDDR